MSTTAPETLPKYLAEGIPKQDDATLRETREFIDELLADRERRREQPVPEDELPEDAEVVENSLKGTVYKELRTCGDENCQCMNGGEKHGPYKYRAYWDGETVRREYLGKAE